MTSTSEYYMNSSRYSYENSIFQRIGNTRLDEGFSTCLLILILELQVLRKFSVIGYAAILLSAYIFWFLTIVPLNAKVVRPNSVRLFLLSCFITVVVSFYQMPINEYITAMTRYGAVMPFLIGVYYRPQVIRDNLDSISRVVILVVFVSALLLFYQILFGRIDFFVDSTFREGYERFGTLLGSVTSYGTSSMVAVIMLYDMDCFSDSLSRLMEVFILLGGVVCLSKSFFINAIIAYTLVMLLPGRYGTKRHVPILEFIEAAIVLIIVYYILHNTFLNGYFSKMIDYTFSDSASSIKEEMVNTRLIDRPAKAFGFYGNPWWYYSFFGVGLRGYAGVLGLSQYPMCHNNYIDIILSQGALTLIAYLFMHIGCLIRSNSRSNPMQTMSYHIAIYSLINMAAGQSSYVTIGGAVLCSIMISATSII